MVGFLGQHVKPLQNAGGRVMAIRGRRFIVIGHEVV